MKNKSKQQIQDQLRQHLKTFRNLNNLTAEVAAEKIGVEIATYRTLEGKKPVNRVISNLEYLELIASLNKMSLSDFILYLERNPRTESGSSVAKRKLYEWEEEILRFFDHVGIPLRERFRSDIRNTPDERKRKLLTLLVRIYAMEEEKQDALINLVEKVLSDVPEDRDY